MSKYTIEMLKKCNRLKVETLLVSGRGRKIITIMLQEVITLLKELIKRFNRQAATLTS